MGVGSDTILLKHKTPKKGIFVRFTAYLQKGIKNPPTVTDKGSKSYILFYLVYNALYSSCQCSCRNVQFIADINITFIFSLVFNDL